MEESSGVGREKMKVQMTPRMEGQKSNGEEEGRMERWKSLIEKAEEEEGRCMTSRRRDGGV